MINLKSTLTALLLVAIFTVSNAFYVRADGIEICDENSVDNTNSNGDVCVCEGSSCGFVAQITPDYLMLTHHPRSQPSLHSIDQHSRW